MRGIFSKLNISKALLTRGASLVVVFATLVAAYAALSMNHTLGWFAKNETVKANGMITQAYHAKFNMEYTLDPPVSETQTTPQTWLPFDGNVPLEELKAPGGTLSISFRVTSISSKPVTITGFGLEAPNLDQESPKFDEKGAHYLSTELQTRLLALKVKSVSQKLTDDTVSARKYLREQGATSAGSIDYLDWVAADANGDKTIVLNPQDSFEFTVEFHFINREVNQNVFKNFHLSGKCARRVYITFDE